LADQDHTAEDRAADDDRPVHPWTARAGLQVGEVFEKGWL
jgi:hypothetical protein